TADEYTGNAPVQTQWFRRESAAASMGRLCVPPSMHPTPGHRSPSGYQLNDAAMTEAVTHHTMDRAPAPVWPPASQTQWTRDGGVHRSSDAFRTHRGGSECSDGTDQEDHDGGRPDGRFRGVCVECPLRRRI